MANYGYAREISFVTKSDRCISVEPKTSSLLFLVPRNDTWIASIEGDQRVNGCSDYEEVAMTRALEPADTIRGRSRWSLQRAADERRHSPSLSSDELDFVATSPRDRRPGKGKYLAYYDAGVVILTERGVPFTMGDERYPACLGRNVSSAE